MTSLEGWLSILSCRRKTDISRFPSALGITLYEIIYEKLRSLREHIQDHNSGHDDPAFSAMANLREQQLSLLTCIGAPMQREELSDSRNRQAAETKGGQNEDQIWQRVTNRCILLADD
jgi:hypothetical protein